VRLKKVNNPQILVVGASGFIGRYVLAIAKQKGFKACGTAHSSHVKGCFRFDMARERIKEVFFNFFRGAKLPEYAVICAAVANMEMCSRNRSESYAVNVDGTIRLIEDLENLGIKSLFVSSGAVYDGKAGGYGESVPPSPINEYGRQKLIVENHILSNKIHGAIVRLSKAVGSNPYEKQLFSEWHKNTYLKQPIICLRGEIFSPTFVEDIANGILMIVKRNLRGRYHLANMDAFSRAALARLFLRVMNKNPDIEIKAFAEFNALEPRSQKTHLDSSKFISATRFIFTPMRSVMRAFCSRLPKNYGPIN